MRKRSGFIIGALFVIIFMVAAQPVFAETVYRVGFDQSPEKRFSIKAMEKMAEYVKEKTNGEYVLRLFPGGQLGPAREQFQQMKMGTLDFGLHTNNSPTLVKEGQNLQRHRSALRFFVPTGEYKKFLKSPLAEKMAGWLEEGGVKVIGYTGYRPPRALTTSQHTRPCSGRHERIENSCPRNEGSSCVFPGMRCESYPHAFYRAVYGAENRRSGSGRITASISSNRTASMRSKSTT